MKVYIYSALGFLFLSYTVHADLSSSEIRPMQQYKSLDRFNKGQLGPSIIPNTSRNPFKGSLEDIVPPLKPIDVPAVKQTPDNPNKALEDIEERRGQAEEERRLPPLGK